MIARLIISPAVLSIKRSAVFCLLFSVIVGTGASLATKPADAFEIPHWATANTFVEPTADQAAAAGLIAADYRSEAAEQGLEFRRLDTAKSDPVKFEDAQSDSDERVSNLFGEVSIRVSHLAVEPRWRSIAPFDATTLFGARCESDEELCNSPLMHVWTRLRSALQGSGSRLEKIRRVNAEVNAAIRYRTDTENYGAPDYWASPEEMARRGSGDCKETALAKMWMLAALDVPLSSMRVVVLKDTRRGLGHAILVVSVAEENLVLDNVSNEIRRAEAISWYQPLFAVSTTGSWIYGIRRPKLIANLVSQANS